MKKEDPEESPCPICGDPYCSMEKRAAYVADEIAPLVCEYDSENIYKLVLMEIHAAVREIVQEVLIIERGGKNNEKSINQEI